MKWTPLVGPSRPVAKCEACAFWFCVSYNQLGIGGLSRSPHLAVVDSRRRPRSKPRGGARGETRKLGTRLWTASRITPRPSRGRGRTLQASGSRAPGERARRSRRPGSGRCRLSLPRRVLAASIRDRARGPCLASGPTRTKPVKRPFGITHPFTDGYRDQTRPCLRRIRSSFESALSERTSGAASLFSSLLRVSESLQRPCSDGFAASATRMRSLRVNAVAGTRRRSTWPC